VDISAYLIRTLEALGLVWNVYRVKESDLRKRVVTMTADGMGD